MYHLIRKLVRRSRERIVSLTNEVALRRHKELYELYMRFVASSERRRIIGTRDAVNLYTLVRARGAKNILEFGTGIGASTAVLALATGNGTVTTLEDSKGCLDISRKLIPPELNARIRYILSPRRAFAVPNIKYAYFSGYRDLPMGGEPYDFVFVDGPDAWVEDGQVVNLPNGDLIPMLSSIAPRALIYVDCRKGAARMYEKYLAKYLRIVERGDDHTIFERTGERLARLEDLEVKDTRLGNVGSVL